MNTVEKSPMPAILLIATFDTKAEETLYLKKKIESLGCRALLMDTGILADSSLKADINRSQVAAAGGASLEEMIASGDKGRCIDVMRSGACVWAKRLFSEGRFRGVLSIGGAQGTDIATAAMRELPFGVPKFMVSTVASGRATFGPFVGTKDIILMHSVADIQGVNFVTKQVFDGAAAAVCGMVREAAGTDCGQPSRPAVALSMLGTITQGAMRAKKSLSERGYDAVAFHQNGTGGIAMEDMIREGVFKGVLDLGLHELGDTIVGGLHASIRDYRLLSAGELGIPQVVAPGSINYAVLGPVGTLSPETLKRKYIVHNPQLTLVRLSVEELEKAAALMAERLNKAKGPAHVFIPLRGFSYPDQEGQAHWDPAANDAFIRALKLRLADSIQYDELDLHINDEAFIDATVDELVRLMNRNL